MKSIAQNIELEKLERVLDIGCGVGVLGLSLKKRLPAIEVELRDRDALALLFTGSNGLRNGIETAEIHGELSLMNLSDKPFDLIVSNFPAKAGAPLLESFIRRSSAHLSPNGRIAIVVVTALAEIVRKTIEETGGTIYHNEKTANYAVFHFRTEPATEPETIEVYIRHRGDFSLQNRIYTLETVYNLPDFDTPGFSIQGAAKLLKGRVLKGNVLFWKPGQGHLPAFLALGSGKKVTAEVTIASNDLLELRIDRPESRQSSPRLPSRAPPSPLSRFSQ